MSDFVKLTATDGRAVHVSYWSIVTITDAVGSTEHVNTRAVLTLTDGKRIGVLDTVAEVLAKLSDQRRHVIGG